MKKCIFMALSWLVCLTPTYADVKITDAWCKAPWPNGAIFMNIDHKDDSLVGATCDAARKVELHNHIKEGDTYKMRQVKDIQVPATLQPGGYHIMLIGLKKPFKPGDKVPVTLQFSGAGAVALDVEVKPIDYSTKGKCCSDN